MSAIIIKDLTFGYPSNPENVFENVSVTLDTDWKLGLTGRNGKGKTTLLRLLKGGLEFSGKISASVNFEYFPLEIPSISSSVRDVLWEINAETEEWEVMKDLHLLGVDEEIFERTYSSLSKGEQTKVLLCALFNKANAFLLIDEPTNHLDIKGREILAQYLKKKSGFILVSHDRSFLDSCIDHVMSINRSSIEIQNCNMTAFLENKRLKEEFEMSQNEKLKKEIKRLETAARRSQDWSNEAESKKFGKQDSGLKADRGAMGAKAAKIMERSKAFQKRAENSAEEKTKLLKDVDRSDALNVKSAGYFADRFLTVRDLVINYDGKIITGPVSFEVFKGERVLISGKNGSGKSSVIKAVLGKIQSFTGEIKVGSQLKISYVDQDTSFLKGPLEIFCQECGTDVTKLFTMLNKLGFEKSQYEKDISSFSEGQKKKLLIAKSLCDESNLYIWDEPLNYIDIISRSQIEDLILLSAPTMIFVEHDRYFCESIATKVIEL